MKKKRPAPAPWPPTIVGNVKRILSLPCDTPPSLWVETFVPAALKAIWTVASPDPKELYHKAFGNSLYHDYKQTLRDSEVIPPESESAATRFYFNALDWADLSVWYLFLADAGLDGLMNWTSQVLKQSQCPNKGYAGQGHGNFYFGAIPDDGRWSGLDFSFAEGTDFYPAAPSHIQLRPGHTGIIAARASFHLWLLEEPVACEARVIIQETGLVLDQVNIVDPDVAAQSPTKTFVKYTNNTRTTQTLQAQWRWTGGPVPEGEVFPDADSTSIFMGRY